MKAILHANIGHIGAKYYAFTTSDWKRFYNIFRPGFKKLKYRLLCIKK